MPIQTSALLALKLNKTLRPVLTFSSQDETEITAPQPEALAHPTGSRLLEVVRQQLVHVAKAAGIVLEQTCAQKTAEMALEQALIIRFGTLGPVSTPFLLRSDNGLVFTSRSFTALVRS